MKGLSSKYHRFGRFLAFIIILVVLFSYAMFQGGFVSWFLFFMLSPFLLYVIILYVVPLKFVVEERVIRPSYIRAGDTIQITQTVRHKTWFPIAFLAMHEVGAKSASKVFFAGFRRKFEWIYEESDIARGQYTLEGIDIVLTDFFGWVERHYTISHKTTFLVYPRTVQVATHALNIRYDQGNIATKLLKKDTTVATSVRDYEQGDKFSWIHWKSFAKGGNLRTKEFEDSQAQKFIVSLQRQSSIRFEGAVTLTASIIESFAKEMSDVSFVMTDDETPGVQVVPQVQRIMQHLAVVEANGENTLKTVVQSRHPLLKQSIVIIVTGELTAELEMQMLQGPVHVKKIICFVVVDKMNNTVMRAIGQHRIIYMTEEMFGQAFAEVNEL